VDLEATWDYVVNFRKQLAIDSYLHVSAAIQCVIVATIVAVLIGIAVYRSPAGSAVCHGVGQHRWCTRARYG